MPSLFEVMKDLVIEGECTNCHAATDPAIAELGDLYHEPDQDCHEARLFGQEGNA